MSTDGQLHSSRYWHERAEEARARADEMHDARAKAVMASIAAMYDKLAKRAARREGADK